MTVGSNQRVPELVAGIDLRSLPLSALEGFVLSRIDGRSSTADIVSLTGLPLDQVVTIVEKLVSLGAVKYRGEAFDAPSGLGPRRDGPSSSTHGSGAPRRSKSSQNAIPQPRRIFSESGVSSPPPELPPQSARPRGGLESGAPSRTHALPPSQQPGVHPGAQAPAGGRRPSSPASKPPAAAASQSPRAPERPSATQAIPPAKAASLAPSLVPEPRLYDPKELEEDVELPLERRKQVLDLYYRLSDVDHYEALGIPYDADKKAIRSAYFALSKVFHPDTMFRKNLGSFKSKMVAIFKLLTEAYETLGKNKSREEYDAYLRDLFLPRVS